MREYDNNLPLIAIHVPKTGGTSFRKILHGWFGDRLLLHYFDRKTEEMPPKYDLDDMHTKENPILLYGHFNRQKGLGIEHYYPEVKQFIAILRDPFEIVVSLYFFMIKNQRIWKNKSVIPEDALRNHILKTKASFLNFFPQEVTFDNYKNIIDTQFVEIGVTEYMDESIKRIANKLNRKYNPGSVQQLNVAERNQTVPYEFKEEFIEKHPLDYAVYNYVLNSYIERNATTNDNSVT